MKELLILAAAAALISAFSGCGHEDAATFPSSCFDDGECFGYACVETPEGGQCAASCEAGCADGFGCGGPDGARCVLGGLCSSDAECGAYACLSAGQPSSRCASSCLEGCADGYACGDGQQCVGECEDSACPAGEICIAGMCGVPSTDDLEGTYFALLSVSIARDKPLMAELTFQAGAVHVVWLVRDLDEDGQTPMPNARRPASESVAVQLASGEAPGTFEFALDGAIVPGAANPLTYRDLGGDFEFSGQFERRGLIQGQLSGSIVNPTTVPLEGSEWAAVCTSDPSSEAGSLAALIESGDRDCGE